VGKKILLCLAVILMLSVVMVPLSVSAQPDRWLTAAEKSFILQLSSRMQEAYVTISGHRDWLKKWNVVTLENMSRLFKGPTGLKVPSGLFFRRGCTLGSVPDTMSDIASTWNDEVCNEFGYVSQKMSSFAEGVDVLQLSADIVMIRITLGRIESSMSKIDKMTGERVDDLCTIREAEEEAKKELDVDDECFIATAVYGTPTAKEIDELRRFRDEYLRKSTIGNKFIQYYYEKSPPIAEFISDHDVVRAMVREGFVEPVVEIIELTESGWAE